MPASVQVFSAISAKASRPSRVMKETLPPAFAAAAAWFEPLPPGPMRKPWPRIVSPMIGRRGAVKARSATKMPRIAMSEAMAPLKLGRDHALGQDDIAIEAPLARRDDGVASLRPLIEGEALQRTHGMRATLGPVDLRLRLPHDRRDLCRIAHHLMRCAAQGTKVSSGSTDRTARSAAFRSTPSSRISRRTSSAAPRRRPENSRRRA